MSQANNKMSTAATITIIPTYADAAKQKPPVVAAARVTDSILTANVNTTSSNSLTNLVTNPASDVKGSNLNPSSDVKVSNHPASDARKMFNPSTGYLKVSNNPMGRLPRKVKKPLPPAVVTDSRRKLKRRRAKVARTARQEERKREMLLFDEEIKLIRGGGDGNERSHSGELKDTDSSEGETSITATTSGRKRTASPTAATTSGRKRALDIDSSDSNSDIEDNELDELDDEVSISDLHYTLYAGGVRDVHFDNNISTNEAQGIIDEILHNNQSMNHLDSRVFVRQSNDLYVYGLVESISQDGTSVRIKIREDGSFKCFKLNTEHFQRYIRRPYSSTKMRSLESCSQILTCLSMSQSQGEVAEAPPAVAAPNNGGAQLQFLPDDQHDTHKSKKISMYCNNK